MIKPDPKIFSDIASVAGGAVSIVSSMRQQVKQDIKARVDELATRMNWVPREDFENLEAQIQKLASDNEDLKKRLEKLEGKKPATKKTTSKKS